jgi:deoxyribodipyrimidine photo-lyase
MKKNKLGIFVFRKDLRLYDNLALIELSKKCEKIIPIFIFDDYQINITENNKYYRSNNAIQFMCESLLDLNNQLNGKLQLFKGDPPIIIKNLIKYLNNKYDNITISFNLDYTKYALKRDSDIINICNSYNIELITIEHDHTLIPFNKMLKSNGLAYMVYGSFYKNAIKTKVNEPIKLLFNNFIKITDLKLFESNIIKNINDIKKFYKENIYLAQHGGRTLALKKLNNELVYKNYSNKRDLLSFNTYQISASLNFGCISIREFYYIIKNNIEIRKQLYWRDFYTCILKTIPQANSYSKMIDDRFNQVKWTNKYNNWNLMMESKTGYLIIDAAMRELIKTGYIGNRVRLILATFWIKYLLINPLHPKYGSQVGFSRYLVDCNTSQNKLNHQWFTDLDLPGRRFAKRGCNSLTGRMMRIDNEMIKKFDPNCEYIKKWLPELKDIPNKELYKWNKDIQKKYNIHYPPIFIWEEQYKKYCKLFKN